MGFISLGASKAAVGLDIGSNSFRVAKVVPGKDLPTLVAAGSIKVPRGAVAGGEILDLDVVSYSIQELMKKVGLKDKHVHIGVSNQKVVTRMIELPYMDTSELKSALQFQAQDYIPIPIEDVILDYEIIGEHMNAGGERMLQVLLVAAQRDMINTFVAVLEKAGLRPDSIDVAAFAAARTLHTSIVTDALRQHSRKKEEIPQEQPVVMEQAVAAVAGGGDPLLDTEGMVDEFVGGGAPDTLPDHSGPHDIEKADPRENEAESVTAQRIALVDIGAGITNLVIMEDGQVRFARVVAVGGDDWTDALVEVLGLPFEEAEEAKVRVGLPPLSGDRYQDVPSELLDRAETIFNVLEREAMRFISEIRRSFEYFVSQSPGAEIDGVVVSGGAARLRSFAEYLARGLQTSVIEGRPLDSMNVHPKVMQEIGKEGDVAYSIATGLAVGGLS